MHTLEVCIRARNILIYITMHSNIITRNCVKATITKFLLTYELVRDICLEYEHYTSLAYIYIMEGARSIRRDGGVKSMVKTISKPFRR